MSGGRSKLKRAIVLPLLVLVLLLHSAATATAQDGTIDWSEPERVWGYEDVADPPFMVADQNRTVHAMNSRTSELGVFGAIDITYRRWTPSIGWSEPVDVVLSPKKNIARIRGLMLDNEGYLHMVFYGGDEQDASMYYTAAPAVVADRAPSWSEPVLIGERAGPINDAAFAGDGQNELFVVYTSNQDGFGAYYTYSLDGGLTWSESESFHLSKPGQAATHYSLLLDDDSRLHAVWSEADLLSGNGETLYYARLDENQQRWTQPSIMALAEDDDLEVDTPALVEHDGRLMMVYHDDWPTTRFLRRSTDSGETWSEPQRLFQQIGSNGPPSFAIDSENNLSMFFGGRLSGNPDIHGTWQSTYQNGDFAPAVPIVSGPRVTDVDGGNGFDPSFAQAVVLQGNTILLTWSTDPGAGLNGVHYTHATTNAPVLPVMLLPTLVPTAAPVPATETPPPTPVPTVTPFPNSAASDTAAVRSPMTPLVLGAVSVLAMVSLVFAGKAVRRKN